jgi:hypothetical protein
MMYREMRLGLAIALLFVVGCSPEPSSSGLPEGEGRPVAAPFVEILCTEDGETRLWTPVVEVQPDGVHVDIENRAGEPTSFFGLGSLDVGKGRHKAVITEPPGKMRVACYPDSQHEKDAKPVRYDLELTDPQDHWIPTELECGSSELQSVISDFSELGKGLPRDPVTLVEEQVKGLRADDVVELAGYPEARVPTVRVVREDSVIAVFGFHRADDGGLAIETGDLCGSEGLRY